MAERAHVSSTEAIDAFKAALVVYLSKSRLLLEDACDEVLRLRTWLQTDRRLYWEAQVRRRQKILEEARQALFGASMANLREPSAAERLAVQRAQRALAEAEEKLNRVKHWTREYEHRVEPLLRQLESLRTVLTHDMPKGVAYLNQILQTLDAYTGMKAPAIEPATEPGGEGSESSAPDPAAEQGGAKTEGGPA
jgi:hypothetical protein